MSDHVDDLDAELADDGEEIRLRRVIGTTTQSNVDVDVIAAVRGLNPDELVGSITQDELMCIFSPTQINRAQWPGGQPITATDDPRVPSKNRGDKAYVRGKWRTVQWGVGKYPHGELVRIEMRVSG